MKSLFFILIFPLAGFAQFTIPPLSPPATVIQQVGLTTVKVQYERPAARGRTEGYIFGTVVRPGRTWRVGAGPKTLISFDTDLTINDKPVPAGKYTLFAITDKKKWTIIFNKDTGDYNYDAKKDALRFDVNTTRTARFYESLTIEIDVIPNDAMVYISWLNTQVAFRLNTGLDQHIKSYIQNEVVTLKSNYPEDYRNAIVYNQWHNGDQRHLLDFVNKGISLNDDRIWYYWKVEELMKQKRNDEALAAAKRAIEVINRSDETEERKVELIRDFEDYIKKIKS